jgi:hypothetical protein
MTPGEPRAEPRVWTLNQTVIPRPPICLKTVRTSDIQELLRHKCIETTVRYTHIQTEGLLKVYRKYHPREQGLYETVDEVYCKRLETVLAGRKKV